MNINGATNSLTVATNEAISFYTIGLNQDPNAKVLLVKDGTTNGITIPRLSSTTAPSALAGPAMLIFTSEAVVSFSRINGTNIQTIVLPPNGETVLTVPTNKVFRFFAGTEGGAAYVLKGTNLIFSEIRSGTEISGPLDVRITNPGAVNANVLSFFSTEDFLVIPELGLLRGPTGSFEITVQKSEDLTNWYPVMIQNSSSDQKAFYRLKLAK